MAVTALEPNRNQPRTHFDSEGLEELAASIRAQGVIQPLIVTENAPGRYVIGLAAAGGSEAQRTIELVIDSNRETVLEATLDEGVELQSFQRP